MFTTLIFLKFRVLYCSQFQRKYCFDRIFNFFASRPWSRPGLGKKPGFWKPGSKISVLGRPARSRALLTTHLRGFLFLVSPINHRWNLFELNKFLSIYELWMHQRRGQFTWSYFSCKFWAKFFLYRNFIRLSGHQNFVRWSGYSVGPGISKLDLDWKNWDLRILCRSLQEYARGNFPWKVHILATIGAG